MERVNNKNGLELYYDIEDNEHGFDYERFVIYDSNKHYINDMVFNESDRQEETKSCLKIVENTSIKELCYYYNYELFENLDDLLKYINSEGFEDFTKDNILENEYLNIIKSNDKVYYCWKND